MKKNIFNKNRKRIAKNESSQLAQFLHNYLELDAPFQPQISTPDNGYNFYLYLQQKSDKTFSNGFVPLYFWPEVFKNYTGIKPIKKVIFSNIQTKSDGIIPLYRGKSILNKTIEIEEPSIFSKDYVPYEKIKYIDWLFNLVIEAKSYDGSEFLFSMDIQIEDLFGNITNPIALNFIRYY